MMGQGRGRHGHHATGPNHGRWNESGRLVTSHGYVAIRNTTNHPKAFGNGRGRYVYEHVLVAERTIGRRLRDDESVHHLDGNRQNNRPENLEVLTDENHARIHNATRPRDGKTGRFLKGKP